LAESRCGLRIRQGPHRGPYLTGQISPRAKLAELRQELGNRPRRQAFGSAISDPGRLRNGQPRWTHRPRRQTPPEGRPGPSDFGVRPRSRHRIRTRSCRRRSPHLWATQVVLQLGMADRPRVEGCSSVRRLCRSRTRPLSASHMMMTDVVVFVVGRPLGVIVSQTSVRESDRSHIRPVASGWRRRAGSPLASTGRSNPLMLKAKWQADSHNRRDPR
jgi:hypothetical protein